jgi:inhibitor of KinA
VLVNQQPKVFGTHHLNNAFGKNSSQKFFVPCIVMRMPAQVTPLTSLIPLGDQAALASFADEAAAWCFAEKMRRQQLPWLVDVVQAYTSVAVFFDLGRIPFEAVRAYVTNQSQLPGAAPDMRARPLHRIPCCYEFPLDLERVAAHTGLTPDEVIRLHTTTEYTVYAIGFCPGFPYLGYLPAELCGVPRLPTPRVRVEAGSVGLTGRQTGIYTEARPGGWNLLGRTPLELVQVADGYFPLRTGHRVRFERIDEREFHLLLGQRL